MASSSTEKRRRKRLANCPKRDGKRIVKALLKPRNSREITKTITSIEYAFSPLTQYIFHHSIRLRAKLSSSNAKLSPSKLYQWIKQIHPRTCYHLISIRRVICHYIEPSINKKNVVLRCCHCAISFTTRAFSFELS